MRILRILICLSIPAFYAGCDSCSDDKEERERLLNEAWDTEAKQFFSESEKTDEQVRAITSPCNANFEGKVIVKGDNEYVCINGNWTLGE